MGSVTFVKIFGDADEVAAGVNAISEECSNLAHAGDVRRLSIAVAKEHMSAVIGKGWCNLSVVEGKQKDVNVNIIGDREDSFRLNGLPHKMFVLFANEQEAAERGFNSMVQLIGHIQSKHGSRDGPSDNETEIGLCIPKRFVGGIIGPKGKFIREIRKESGIRIQFGEDAFKNQDGVPCVVLCAFGTKEQIAKGCQLIAERVASLSMSLESKLVFMVTKEWVGMVIGKKGANINAMKKAGGKGLWIEVSRESIQLPAGLDINTVTLYGPRDKVGNALEKTVDVLGDIAKMAKRNIRRN